MTEKRCILVVEDEPSVSEMVADALSDSYRTVVVDAAADALEQIRLGSVDLILLDYLLPGGGSTQILAAAEVAGLPVVIMSGDGERSSELSSGSHPFVAKPFGIENLLGTVRAALGKETSTIENSNYETGGSRACWLRMSCTLVVQILAVPKGYYHGARD